MFADECPLELIEGPAMSGLLERRLVDVILVKVAEVESVGPRQESGSQLSVAELVLVHFFMLVRRVVIEHVGGGYGTVSYEPEVGGGGRRPCTPGPHC